MARRKVKLAYIINDSKRRITFNKRKKGLIKKVDEITTLCGIEACAIIFGENNAQPEIWPSPVGVHTVLSRFRGLPETEQSKKMQNQESFLGEKIQKGQEQLNKLRNENRRKELTQLMFQCIHASQIADNVGMNDLNGLSWMIDQNMKHIERRMEEIRAAPVVERRMEDRRAAAVVESRAENVIGAAPVVENHAENVIIGAAPVVENRAENVIGRELGMENNVGAMQPQPWSLDFMTNNNNFGDLLPFDENGNNAPNGFWP
ncbi:agamous MADS-box protein AGL80 [Trifolium repens]|nr:agamous MADS-box protein AGL80 [Trifolium repens]